jgi:hypothetical protein
MVSTYVTGKHRRAETKEQEDTKGKKPSEKQRNKEINIDQLHKMLRFQRYRFSGL